MENVFEFITSLTLFGAWWWFWIISTIWVLSIFYGEDEKNGYISFFTSIVFFILIYKWSDINIINIFTLKRIGIYIGIGFLYSLIKTYFYSRNGGDRDNLKDHVFRWWFQWPVSLLYWILSDLIRDLYDILFTKLVFIYYKIFELGIKKEK